MRAFKAAEKAGKEVIETEIDSVSGKSELRFAKSMRRGSLQARYRELHDQTGFRLNARAVSENRRR
jgi:hypothetical protein